MAFIRHLKNRAMSKYGYDDTRQTRFRRLLLGMGVAMLLFFLLLKIFLRSNCHLPRSIGN